MSQLADDSAVRVAIDAREKARRDQIRADVYRRATAPTVNSQRTDTVPDRPGFPGYGNAMAQQSAPPEVSSGAPSRASGPYADAAREQAFQKWYAPLATKNRIDPNPDSPQHQYDYRRAFEAGVTPGRDGHWPSEFKLAAHPNRYVDGEDTITGRRAIEETAPADLDRLADSLYQQDVRARIAQVEARMATKIKATVDEVVQPRPGEDPRATEARRQNQLNWVLQQKGIAPISMPDRPVGELGMMNEAGRSALRFGYSTVGALAGSLPEMAGTVGKMLTPQGSVQRAGFEGLQRGGRYVRETMGEGAAGFPPSDSVTMQGFLPDNAGSVPRWLAARGPEAVGSVGVSLLPGIGIGGKLGAAAAMATGTALETGTTYDDAYRSLVAQGASPDQAAKHATVEASIYGAVSGVLEKFPAAEFILKDRAAMGRVLRAARGAFIEGSTESAQELAQGLTQSIGGSAPDAMDEIGSRMAASGILGAIPGGGLGMVTGGNHEALPPGAGQNQTQMKTGANPAAPSEPLSEVDQARAMVNAGKLTPEQAAHLAELIRQVEAEEQTPPPAPVVSTPVAAPVPTQGDLGGAAGIDAATIPAEATDAQAQESARRNTGLDLGEGAPGDATTGTGVRTEAPAADERGAGGSEETPPTPVQPPAGEREKRVSRVGPVKRGTFSAAAMTREVVSGGVDIVSTLDDQLHPDNLQARAEFSERGGQGTTGDFSYGQGKDATVEATEGFEGEKRHVKGYRPDEETLETYFGGDMNAALESARYMAGGKKGQLRAILTQIKEGFPVSPQTAQAAYWMESLFQNRMKPDATAVHEVTAPENLPDGTTFDVAGHTHEIINDRESGTAGYEGVDGRWVPLGDTLWFDAGTLDTTGGRRGNLDERIAEQDRQAEKDIPFSPGSKPVGVQGLTERQAETAAEKQAVEVGKRLGVGVRFFAAEDGGPAVIEGAADARSGQRTVWVESGRDDHSVRRILTHEWVHDLRTGDPEAYRALVRAVEAADPKALRRGLATYLRRARGAGLKGVARSVRATPAVGVEEALATVLERQATAAGFWGKLSGHTGTKWQKIVDALRRLVTRLGLRGGVAKQLLRAVEEASRKGAAATVEARGPSFSPGKPNDTAKLDFLGSGDTRGTGRQLSLLGDTSAQEPASQSTQRGALWAEQPRQAGETEQEYALRRKSAPAERATGRLFSPSERAAKQAQQTATGKEPVEDPRGRVNPGKSPGGKRAIDALREALQQFNPPASRPDAAIRTEAARKLANNYAGERARLIEMAGKGGMPTDTDMRAMRSISVHEAAVALRSNTPQAWQAATESQHAYDRFGAMASRAFAQRQVHLGGKRTHAELMQETLVHDLLAPSHQFAADTARHEKAMAKLEQERDSLRSKLEAAEKAAEKSGAENEAARAELQKRLKQLDRRESDLKAMKERAMKAEAELNARIARDLAKFNIDVTTPIAAAAREVAGDVRAASGAGPAPTNYKGQTDLAGHEESGALTVKNGPDTPRLEGTGVDKFGVGLQKNIPGMDGTFEGTDGPKGVADEATHLRLLMAAMRGRRIVQAAKGNVWDRFYEFWVNGLISGVRTIGINISTNTVYGAYSTFGQRFADAMVNLALGPNPLREGATLSEFSAMARTIAPALRKAWLNAVDTFRNEMPVFEDEINLGQGLTTHAVERTVAIPGKLGRGVRVPSRVSMMADEFNKTLWGTLHAAALAHRHASTEGLKGDALWNRVGELMGDISHPLWFAALHEAKRVTFQEDLERLGLFGKMAHGVTSLRNAVPGVRYLFPFVRTPTNLVFTGLGHTPLASAAMLYKLAHDGIVSIRKGASGDYYYRGNRSALANDISRNLVAWGMFLALGSLAAGDDKDGPYITGTNQLAPGIPKTSIRIGGKWYNYGYLEPMASMLSLTVDLSNNLMRGGPRTALRGVTDSISDTASRLSDSVPMLTGIANISDLIESMRNRGSAGAHQSAVRWAGQFTASWVPNFIRSGLQAADPNVRDYRTLGLKGDSGAWGGFTRTVGYRALGRLSPLDPPSMKYDLWGRAVQRDAPGFGPVSDWAFRVLSPASGTPRNIGTEARMDRLIMNWNQRHPDVVFAPKPPDPFFDKGGKSVPMTEREYEALQHESGRTAVMRLGRMRLNDAKPTASDIKDIQNEISRARREVRDRLWASRERAKS